jgi:serine/threonine protein kinase
MSFQVLSREISLHNWIEILHQGGNVKRSVELPKSLPVDVTLSSDIFDQCLAWDSGQSGSNLSLLGEGGFAKTFKYDIAIQSNFIVSVVIKQNSSRDKKNDEKPAWYREACHTRRICHDKIIRYFDKPILYRRYYYCIMEYGGISLHDKYYHNESNANMDLKDIATAMLHIADAINYLHNHMDNVIIHRDIRSSNVLVSERNVYKLIDFGISSEKIKEQSAIHSDVHFGNPLWKSPEYCRYLLGKLIAFNKSNILCLIKELIRFL